MGTCLACALTLLASAGREFVSDRADLRPWVTQRSLLPLTPSSPKREFGARMQLAETFGSRLVGNQRFRGNWFGTACLYVLDGRLEQAMRDVV